MLVSLEIKNFGLIDSMELEFDNSFTVLTGETGAGKSIVIEALHMLLGGKAYGEYIKSGKDKALLQAMFKPGSAKELEQYLDEQGLELEDGDLILTRQLSRSGRNICRVNGQVINLQSFKQIGKYLVDMHGQHEQQSLLNPSRHMELLDRYAGNGLLELKKEVSTLYSRWQSVQNELDKIKSSEMERSREIDLLQYQVGEIDKAELSPGEEDDLEAEKRRLENSEKLARLAHAGYSALYSGEDGTPAAVDRLGEAVQNIEELQEIDPEFFSTLLDSVSSALYQVEEAARDIVSYRDNIEYNPARLEEVENRLDEIKRLKSKYGSSIEEILDFRNKAAEQLEYLENSIFKKEELENEASELEQKYMEKAKKLSGERQKAAQKLKEDIESELKDLEMKEVTLDIRVNTCGPSSHGLENIEFQISTNPGEPPRPLAKIASGGELSRTMLAFKSVLAAVDQIPTLVFDEVDTGIGGKTLQAVAKKLKDLSTHRQTVVVTHAAPIAALAGTHYCIYKHLVEGRTVTEFELLTGEKRLMEVARMLGGRDASKPVIEHAKELLEQ